MITFFDCICCFGLFWGILMKMLKNCSGFFWKKFLFAINWNEIYIVMKTEAIKKFCLIWNKIHKTRRPPGQNKFSWKWRHFSIRLTFWGTISSYNNEVNFILIFEKFNYFQLFKFCLTFNFCLTFQILPDFLLVLAFLLNTSCITIWVWKNGMTSLRVTQLDTFVINSIVPHSSNICKSK
jgi:hypothetical protein